jgi:hypothetical protein
VPATFEEFWFYYLRQHRQAKTRNLHFLGTGLALATLAAFALTYDYRWLIATVPVAYALAWLSHVMIEDNAPATFRAPLWSLRADIRMFRMWLSGNLARELAKAGLDQRNTKP